jgi:hypothetical protein
MIRDIYVGTKRPMEVVVIDHASPMQYQVSGQRLAQSVPTAGFHL